jgi:hypothetical protein
VTISVAYIDTIELFSRYSPKEVRRRIEPIYGRRLRITECVDRGGRSWGYRIVFQTPSISVLKAILWLEREHHAVLCRVDVAYDLVDSRERIETHVLLLWRRSGPMDDETSTLNWVDYRGRKRRGGRSLTLYSDKESKVTGEPNVTHLELKLLNAAAIRRTGLLSALDLIQLNPRKIFERNIKPVEFDGTALIGRLLRKAVAYDRKTRRHRRESDFADALRASLPRRARRILLRLGVHRAQRAKDLFPAQAKKWKSIPIEVINLPDRLSWPKTEPLCAIDPDRNIRKGLPVDNLVDLVPRRRRVFKE